ncbi:uncharacterized protein ZK1073.1-like isoform X1 [Paramacrobiotus metropolitanus]|uniref:uncharacterized protein ZK1073.1-like isoform X1 n=1 Tax=Paramacrobiotus metropolitanus TaxID=2943436 RepID=UPI0024456892|nr:uncharacterized protein ZK1073.1-like isoform X1 [Paramacrobiotus metropolitanus]XP_055353607.1 uncharacterized protein ZK1073.1-like isoform X1 [Paramacrobiotus metropolitanus]
MALDNDQLQIVTVRTRHCGEVDLHVLGDVSNVGHKPVFLTVHDFGSNATSFNNFLLHPSMAEVRPKSVWLNFELPGQGTNAPELPVSFKFPTLDEVAEDLAEVLHQLKIECVVGFGEGAGANILCRFAMAYPTKISGLILVHPTATSAGFMEWAKEKLVQWNVNMINPTAEEYLVMYKFGSEVENSEASDRQRLIQQYIQEIRNQMNHKNMFAYMDAFHKPKLLVPVYRPAETSGTESRFFLLFLLGNARKIGKAKLSAGLRMLWRFQRLKYSGRFGRRADFSSQLRSNLKCDCLIICGSKGSFLHTVQTMHTHMNPQNSTFVKIDDVADALLEAPEQVTRNLLLFVKGLGMLTTVYTPAERASVQVNASHERRRISMHEADTPRCASPSRPATTQ